MYSRADDARARLRCRPALPGDAPHRCHLAGLPDHPRRPAASRRDRDRRGDRLHGPAHRLRAAQRRRRGHAGTRTARPTRCRTCSAGRSSSSSGPTSRRDSATRSRSRRSTTRCCATGPCRSASTAACWPARVAERVLVIPSIDLERGRSRVVYWPGAAAGIGAPTDRPDRIAERLVAQGAPVIHLVDFEGARHGVTGQPRGRSGRSPRGRPCRSSWPAASSRPRRSSSPSRPAPPASSTTTAIADRPDDLRRLPARRRRLAGGRPGPAAGTPGRLPLAAARAADPGAARRRAARRPASTRLVVTHGGTDPDLVRVRSLVRRTMPRSWWPAGSATSTASVGCAIPVPPASSSGRPSSPVPSTFPLPWRLPHDPRPVASTLRHGARPRPGRRLLGACTGRGRPRHRPSASAAPSDRRRGRLPDEPARAAAGRRDPRRHDRDRAWARSSCRIEADLSPIAAGNFVALAECGYYDGVVFHRLVPGFRHPGRRPGRGPGPAARATRSRTSR